MQVTFYVIAWTILICVGVYNILMYYNQSEFVRQLYIGSYRDRVRLYGVIGRYSRRFAKSVFSVVSALPFDLLDG